MNSYQKFVSKLARMFDDGKSLPLGGIPSRKKRRLKRNARVALILSPHPDDECIVGGFALRLMREAGMRVINVAVTLGSNKLRRAERWKELSSACKWIGFDLEQAAPGGLEKINLQTRTTRTSVR